jgi:hypothetical protein
MNAKVWMRLDLVGVLLAAMAGVSQAGTYYVSTEGSADNDGSYAKPWPSVAVALEKVGGGSTVVLKRGEYRGPITVTSKAAGTKENPTIIKSEKKWGAAIVGSTGENPALSSDKDCPWVVFDGFEIYGAAAGIWLGGEHNTARNCWVHNNWGFDGIGSHAKGAVIENNLIEYNGQNPQFHHGIYADSDGLVVRNNIVRHNAGFGIHCYSDVKNAYIANNLVYGHTFRPGILIACSTHVGKNVVVNNTVVDNATGIRISGGNGDKIYNNIVVATNSAVSLDEDTVGTMADYNLCVPASPHQGPHGMSAEPGFVASGAFCYWLRKDSAARGKGAAEFAPKTDFWGRTRPIDKAPDLGAFPYSSYWADEDTSRPEEMVRGYWGWPYRFARYREIRDLWFLPENEK